MICTSVQICNLVSDSRMHLSNLIAQTGYFRIKVIPQQPKTELRGLMSDGTIKIALKAAPEKGKANKELIEFVAGELGIAKDLVTITSGLTSRIKIIHVELLEN